MATRTRPDKARRRLEPGALPARRDGCRGAGRRLKLRHMMTALNMPADPAAVLDLTLPDLAATEALGRALAPLLRVGDVVALHGDLGAGKTALARALIRALPGARGAAEEEVPSPTFTLVQTYERAPAPVWHVDLYRIEDPAELRELGLSEAFAEGITLLEWPDRLGDALPAEALNLVLTFDASGNGRRARLQGGGDWPQRLTGLRP